MQVQKNLLETTKLADKSSFNDGFLVVIKGPLAKDSFDSLLAFRQDSTAVASPLIDSLYDECLKKQLKSKALRPIRGYLNEKKGSGLLESDSSSDSDNDDESLNDFLVE